MWKGEHLTFEGKKVIYHGLVESHLNYAISTWGSVFAKNLTATDTASLDHVPDGLKILLVATQNKVVRAIFRKHKYDKKENTHTSMTPLYKKRCVLKLCDI